MTLLPVLRSDCDTIISSVHTTVFSVCDPNRQLWEQSSSGRAGALNERSLISRADRVDPGRDMFMIATRLRFPNGTT